MADRRATLLALAERVEREPATYALECEIADAVDDQSVPAPRYMCSLNAAVTLARSTGCVILHLSDTGADGLALAKLGKPGTGREHTGIGTDLCSALTTAALRALAEEVENAE